MIERRRSPRTSVDQDIFVRIRASLEARIVNISPCGALLELGAPLRPSLECDLRFPARQDGDLRVRARVHRCRLESFLNEGGMPSGVIYRAGVEFLHANEEACERSMRQIAELMGGAPELLNEVRLELFS